MQGEVEHTAGDVGAVVETAACVGNKVRGVDECRSQLAKATPCRLLLALVLAGWDAKVSQRETLKLLLLATERPLCPIYDELPLYASSRASLARSTAPPTHASLPSHPPGNLANLANDNVDLSAVALAPDGVAPRAGH